MKAPHLPQSNLLPPAQSSSRRSSSNDSISLPGRRRSRTSSETKFPETKRKNARKRPRNNTNTREQFGVLFEQEHNDSGAYVHHANLLHTVGRGASLFYDMFGAAATTAVLPKDLVKHKAKTEEKRGFIQLEEIPIPALPKAKKALPMELGSHTLFCTEICRVCSLLWR